MSAAMKLSPVDTDAFVQMRDQLIARRQELREELERIEAALRLPTSPPKPRSNRRAGSRNMLVEAHVREHPGQNGKQIAEALGLAPGVLASVLWQLTRNGRLTRERLTDREPWTYRVQQEKTDE